MSSKNFLHVLLFVLCFVVGWFLADVLFPKTTPPPVPRPGYTVDTYANYADKTVCYVLLVGESYEPRSISCLPLANIASADIKWPGWREAVGTPDNPLLPVQGPKQ